jgi:hypothetical protein
MAIETATNARWAHSVTLKILVRRISNINVAIATRKIPAYSMRLAVVGITDVSGDVVATLVGRGELSTCPVQLLRLWLIAARLLIGSPT